MAAKNAPLASPRRAADAGLAKLAVEQRKKWADYLKTMTNQMVASRIHSIAGT
jgi:hypothetical protein